MSAQDSPKPAVTAPPLDQEQVRLLLRAAWLAILLGLLAELVVLGVKIGFDELGSAAQTISAAAQTITWPFFVCIGVAFGQTLGKAYKAINQPAKAMGIAGLFAAPAAFNASKAIHRGVGAALDVDVNRGVWIVVLLLSIVKAIEYGLLAAAVGKIQKKPWGHAWAHVATGLIVGVVFGAIVVAVIAIFDSSSREASTLISTGANELLIPTGCALILFASQALSKRIPTVPVVT